MKKFQNLNVLLIQPGMNRIILVIIITLSCSWPLFAQGKKSDPRPSQCRLAADRTPELRSFRVGMSQAAVLARFPGTSVEKPDKFGITRLRLVVIDTSAITRGSTRDKGVQPDTLLGNENSFVVDNGKFPVLKGVRRIQFQFLDGRLSYLQVAYDDSIKWSTVDEFAATVAKALNLPAEWSLPPDTGGSDQARELRCEAFVITADLTADPTDTRIGAQLSLEDLAATKVVEKRQDDFKEKAQAAEDAKRKTFKP